MTSETTITICGHDVLMRYCAAAETGFFDLAGREATVFAPTVTAWDDEGKPTKFDPPTATTGDYIRLAIAAIVAAYARREQDPPIKAEDILYDASPAEVTTLITRIIALRNQWYGIPSAIKDEMKPEEKASDPKNAQPPTTTSS